MCEAGKTFGIYSIATEDGDIVAYADTAEEAKELAIAYIRDCGDECSVFKTDKAIN